MFKKAFHFIFTVCGMLLGLGVSQAGIELLKVRVGEIDHVVDFDRFCLSGFRYYFSFNLFSARRPKRSVGL